VGAGEGRETSHYRIHRKGIGAYKKLTSVEALG